MNLNTMNNDLKNFLEKYHDNEIFSDYQLGEIQYVIIPKVLDLVEKEVEKMVVNTPNEVVLLNKELPSTLQTNYYNQAVGYVDAVNDISTIIKNLRV